MDDCVRQCIMRGLARAEDCVTPGLRFRHGRPHHGRPRGAPALWYGDRHCYCFFPPV